MYEDKHETPLAPVAIAGGKADTVAVEYEKEFTYLSTQSEDFSRITFQISWTPELRAPIQAGTEVGEQTYYLGEKQIGTCRIIAAEAVEKAEFGDYLKRVWEEYLVA